MYDQQNQTVTSSIFLGFLGLVFVWFGFFLTKVIWVLEGPSFWSITGN